MRPLSSNQMIVGRPGGDTTQMGGGMESSYVDIHFAGKGTTLSILISDTPYAVHQPDMAMPPNTSPNAVDIPFKTYRITGEWDKEGMGGQVRVVVAKRFHILFRGAASWDQVMEAIRGIDYQKLESMKGTGLVKKH